MAEELVSVRKYAVTMVAMANTLDGPSHTPGAEEEMLGQAVGERSSRDSCGATGSNANSLTRLFLHPGAVLYSNGLRNKPMIAGRQSGEVWGTNSFPTWSPTYDG